jgi:hypothetical protein
MNHRESPGLRLCVPWLLDGPELVKWYVNGVQYKEMEVEPTVHPIFKAGTERSSLQYKRLYGIPVLKGKKQVNGSSSVHILSMQIFSVPWPKREFTLP